MELPPATDQNPMATCEHPQALVVALKSAGNPDFGQNPKYSVSPTRLTPCHHLQHASECCRRYIAEHDLGAGNWTGGTVYHPTKGPIAQVSYNGRVWRYDPQAAGHCGAAWEAHLMEAHWQQL